MYDVVVIGGGVIGLTAAWEAARRDLRVCVLEQGHFGREASWAGAGILPPGPVRETADPLDPFAAAASRMWPRLSEHLRETTGIDNGFRRCGGLMFSSRQSSPAGDELARLQAAGVECQPLQAAELATVEPAVRRPEDGEVWSVPAVAQVRNPRHLKALVAACLDEGVDLRPGQPVIGFETDGSHVLSARTPTDRLPAARFVAAGGAWSTQLLAGCGMPLKVEPVRGQIVLLSTPRSLFSRILECGPRYLVPRPDGRILIGSTEEWVGFVKQTTAAGINGLLEFATGLVPDLKDARFEDAWSGLRPHVKRGRPYIGPVPDRDNLLLATGHFRGGLNLSPITGRIIAQLLVGEPPEVSIDAFGLAD